MLEVQLEATAGGRFEGLLGDVAEEVAIQPVTGRCKGGRVHTRTPPTRGQRRAWPRSTRGGAGVGGSGKGVGTAASKQRAVCMCRLCVGCARAGLREWLVAFEARAGRLLRCF